MESPVLPGFSLTTGLYRGREGWTRPLKEEILLPRRRPDNQANDFLFLYLYPQDTSKPTPLSLSPLGYTYNTYSNYSTLL